MSNLKFSSFFNLPSFLSGVSFYPTSVSGTSQTLDISRFNFFDGGTHTDDVSVVLTNVPNEARWSYTFTPVLKNYELSNSSYDGVQFDLSSQSFYAQSIAFSDDGTKLFFLDFEKVFQYTLTTPFDLNTASYDNISFDVTNEDSTPQCIFVAQPGEDFYIVGDNSDIIHQYSLSNPFDLSTASYANRSFSVSETNTILGMYISPNGTKMFVSSDEAIYQYSISFYNVDTASYDNVNLDLSSSFSNVREFTFNPDGTRLFICETDTDSIYQYSLTTPFDLSTATYDNVSLTLVENNYAASPKTAIFNDDGSKMFVLSGDNLFQYTSTTTPNLTLFNSLQNQPKISPQGNERVTYTFYTVDGGSTIYLIDENVI